MVYGAESRADQVLTDPARDPSTWSATAPASALAELTSKLHVCVQRVRAAETIDLHAQVLQHCLLLGLGLRALFACSGFVADAELDSKWLRVTMTMMMMMTMMLMMLMQMMMMIICVWHVTPGRLCHMLPWGARVTWYPGQSKAKERKGKARKANEAKQKRSKSNCDARHVTCYPRAGVSHVTPGRACHMLPLGRPLFWLRVESC